MSQTQATASNSSVCKYASKVHKQFMKGKLESLSIYDVVIAEMNDPLQRSEEFAVSLRKKKKEVIIRDKRMRLMTNRQTGAAGTT